MGQPDGGLYGFWCGRRVAEVVPPSLQLQHWPSTTTASVVEAVLDPPVCMLRYSLVDLGLAPSIKTNPNSDSCLDDYLWSRGSSAVTTVAYILSL